MMEFEYETHLLNQINGKKKFATKKKRRDTRYGLFNRIKNGLGDIVRM